jgi:hypothetical protein
MELNEAKENYIFKVKIPIRENSEDYIVLREPTTKQFAEFSETDDKHNFAVLCKLMPSCIVESSFTNNGEPASAQQVADFVSGSSTIQSDIINKWASSLPFPNPDASDRKNTKN